MKKLINFIGWSVFWLTTPIVVMFSFIVKWFADLEKKSIVSRDYLICEHGSLGNDIHFLIKTCDDCRGKLQENGYRMDEFIEEYKKECRTRYLTTYHDVVKRVTE